MRCNSLFPCKSVTFIYSYTINHCLFGGTTCVVSMFQTFFASVLGLVPTQTVHPEEIKIENKIDKVLRSRTPIPIPIVAEPVVPEFKAPLPPTTRPRNLRSVPSRNKSSKFFKDHPFLAITSTKGQECLEKFGERKPPPLISNAPAHEKDCRSEITTEPYCTPKIVTPKKRRLKDNQYLHYYSLGATDRLLRNTELIVGKFYNNKQT